MNFNYLSLSLFLSIFGIATDCSASHPFPHKAKKAVKTKSSGTQAAVCLATVGLLATLPIVAGLQDEPQAFPSITKSSLVAPTSEPIIVHKKQPKSVTSLGKMRTKKSVQQPQSRLAHKSPKTHRTHRVKSSSKN